MRRLALVALVLLAAGCGGNGGGGLTQEEFVAELEQICADFNAKQDELGEPQSLQDVADIGPQVEEQFDEAVQSVRDLGDPPDEIADEVNRFLEIADEQKELLGRLVDAAEEGDLAQAEQVATEGQELDDEADALATEIGADECAED